MSFKDLASKSKLFAKLAMRRLAQDPFATPDGKVIAPEDWGKMTAEEMEKAYLPSNKDMKLPQLAQVPSTATTNKSNPQTPTAAPQAALNLPEAVLKLLEPYKGKGLLNVVQNGKNLSVTYNARGMSDTALQRKLQAALPGYNVNVIGKTEFTPQMANY